MDFQIWDINMKYRRFCASRNTIAVWPVHVVDSNWSDTTRYIKITTCAGLLYEVGVSSECLIGLLLGLIGCLVYAFMLMVV
jgi:hypothetical protein